MNELEKQFEGDMIKIAKMFIQDVINNGKEKIDVRIDSDSVDFTFNFGGAGGGFPLEYDDGHAPLIASEFATLIIAQSAEDNINLNFEMTVKDNNHSVIEVSRISSEQMN